ncbi:Hypothetical protein NTJ_15387 [Nesidiocoris tenuis]|uniref:Peptidase S1 domain-containing protein n=1 Tax=Nesidiocoris tenuis TaxID=355587 RepID=A0ABN7BDW7_9HEMI|nr:Hypothetical protein NTJ_15387 [Nesidiocoris tenuis]
MVLYRSAKWLILLGFLPLVNNGQNEDKIIGGKLSSVGAAPYLASVQQFKQHKCGGTLLSLSIVLTACHCFGTFYTKPYRPAMKFINVSSPASEYRVHMGHPDLATKSSRRQIRQAKKVLVHPKCKSFKGALEWDFGIVVTVMPFNQTTDVCPFRLFTLNKMLYEERITELTDRSQCSVLGWGITSLDSRLPSRYLKTAKMKLINHKYCRHLMRLKFGKLLSLHDFGGRAQICAVAVNGTDSDCLGDSGGPCICGKYIVGTVSYGFACGQEGLPGIFAKLSDFVEWYQDLIGGTLRSSVSKRQTSLAFLTIITFLLE